MTAPKVRFVSLECRRLVIESGYGKNEPARRSLLPMVAALLRSEEREAEAELALAEALTTELSATMDALRAGDFSKEEARRIRELPSAMPDGCRQASMPSLTSRRGS
ncbi:hypothetical protein ACFFGH_31555 [Lysobacter korlensis]|uniref:Uncharacterized protein n=1 Tax=Lysobacter korlensis TaxID=553636 RepID=A0ABV6S0P0_9GAMM